MVVLGVMALVSAARADILVMQGTDGHLLITNQGGQRSGYKVISRHREFFGSSGMGLSASVGGDSSKYEDAVIETANKYSLDPSLVKAVIRAESNFQAMAVSPKGAMGLMQLMPDTARMHEVRNAFDPAQNIHGGVRHLRYLMNRYDGNLDLVLSAYNAGTKPVDLARGIPRISETQEYVRRVRFFRAVYQSREEKKATPATMVAAVKAPMMARVDLAGKTIEQIYGVPIVLRDLRTRR